MSLWALLHPCFSLSIFPGARINKHRWAKHLSSSPRHSLWMGRSLANSKVFTIIAQERHFSSGLYCAFHCFYCCYFLYDLRLNIVLRPFSLALQKSIVTQHSQKQMKIFSWEFRSLALTPTYHPRAPPHTHTHINTHTNYASVFKYCCMISTNDVFQQSWAVCARLMHMLIIHVKITCVQSRRLCKQS